MQKTIKLQKLETSVLLEKIVNELSSLIGHITQNLVNWRNL